MLEQRLSVVRRTLLSARAFISGSNRSDAAITADLARRIQKLEDAAEKLEEALNSLPVLQSATTQDTNFKCYGTWTNTTYVNFTVPSGKTRADVIAVGYDRLWARDTPTGGGGDPGGGGGTPTPGLPSTLEVTDNYGGTFTMNSTMIGYADIIRRTAEAMGANRDAVIIAFMTVFVESVWKMYANSTVPESLNYPHDAVGSDNDSLGLFQQRPSAGWGSVAELMDVGYNAAAFIGGPSGPNAGNPPGLLDISGWEYMPKGVAAQTVQVSAFPERYALWETGATQLYDAISGRGANTLQWPFVPEPSPNGDMPPVGSSDEPLAEYGPRNLTGAFHEGMDFGYRNAVAGAPIPAAGSGTVHLNQSGFMGYGNTIIINHGENANGFTVYTLYAHRQGVDGPAAGETVQAGDIIGYVGNTGNSLGAHLHFEVHLVPPGGSLTWDYANPSFDSNRTAVNPRDYVGSGDIGNPGGPGGPGNPGAARRIQTRVSIGGQASEGFHPSNDGDFQVHRPTWGRTMEVEPGQNITVALQSITDGGSTVAKSATKAVLTAIANFS